MAVEKINTTDSLNDGRVKLNAAIDQSNEAITKATTADTNASQAVTTANSVQEQFNQVVIEGDSSVEAAQARVSSTGTTYTTLKDRLDQEYGKVTADLAQNKQQTFPFDLNKETILYTSFNGSRGTELDLYISQDGVNLQPIHTGSIFRYTESSRDFSIIDYNDFYYLTFYNSTDKQIGITKTKDFLSYDSWLISLDSTVTHAYAPQWFVDGNNIYILVSLCFNDQKEEDDTLYLQPYYLKAIDSELKTFETPIKIQYAYNPTQNRIDPAIYKINGVYHQFVKHENVGTMEHHTFEGESIENAIWTHFQNIDFSNPNLFKDGRVEGASLVYFQDKYWLYGDKYAEQKTAVVTSTDLQTWTQAQEVKNPLGVRTKHFDCIVLDDKQKNDIANFVFKNSLKEINEYYLHAVRPFYDNIVRLSDYVVGTTFTPDVNLKGKTLYQIDKANMIVDKIVVPWNEQGIVPSTRYNLSELHLYAWNTGSLTLKHNPNVNVNYEDNYIYTPSLVDFIINTDNGNTENLIVLKRYEEFDQFYRLVSQDNSKYMFDKYYTQKQNEYKRVDLSSIAVNNQVDNLILGNNTVYYHSTSNPITVNSVDLSKIPQMRGRVYFCLLGQTSVGSITLVHGDSSKMYFPSAANFVISKANGNNENMIPLTNHWGGLRLVTA